MKQIDIIMLTNTANNDIYRMTLDAVISLRKSSKEDLFNIKDFSIIESSLT